MQRMLPFIQVFFQMLLRYRIFSHLHPVGSHNKIMLQINDPGNQCNDKIPVVIFREKRHGKK